MIIKPFEIKNNGVPIFRQIINHFEGLINIDEMQAHQKLPSVRNFAKDIGVNPATVYRAYGMLVEKGLVIQNKGKRLTVAPNLKPTASMESLNENIKSLLLTSNQLGLTHDELITELNNHL